MAVVDLTRVAVINYKLVKGNSFVPPPVSFIVDNAPEDFSGFTVKFRLFNGPILIKEITNTAGITIVSNILQYNIAADDLPQSRGFYKYEVTKTDINNVIVTIQSGVLEIIEVK